MKILSKTFDKAPKGIIEYEKKIYEFSKEWAAIYIKEGKIIKDITTNLNDSVVVGKHLSKLEGAIVTHNHPLGSSLSGGDILTFLSTGMKEVRAVAKTDQSVFSLKNLGKRFTQKEIRDIETIVENLIKPLKGKVDPVYIDRMKVDSYIRELQKLEGRIEYIHYKP